MWHRQESDVRQHFCTFLPPLFSFPPPVSASPLVAPCKHVEQAGLAAASEGLWLLSSGTGTFSYH